MIFVSVFNMETIKFGFDRGHLLLIFLLLALKIYLPLNGKNHFNPLRIRGHIK